MLAASRGPACKDGGTAVCKRADTMVYRDAVLRFCLPGAREPGAREG